MARVCDFNGHQASFQAEKGLEKGGGVRGGRRGVVREVMKTIHLVTSLTEREFEVLDFSQRFSERVLCRFMLNAAVTCGDHVQEVLEETTERTSS